MKRKTLIVFLLMVSLFCGVSVYAVDWYGDSISRDLIVLAKKGNPSIDIVACGVGGETTEKTINRIKKSINNGNHNDIIITTGTHSITHDDNVEFLLLELEKCLDYCFARNSNMNISLSLIPYTAFDRYNTEIQKFNSGIVSIVNNTKYQGYKIYVKDFNSLIKPESLKADGIHLKGGVSWRQ